MKKNTKEVLISEKLEDRSNKLSDGLTKIKPMYIGCESLIDVASTIDVINEEYSNCEVLVSVSDSEDIKSYFKMFDTKAGIACVCVIDSEYADNNYSVVVSDLAVSNKSWIPNKLALLIEDILEIKKLPYNVYIGTQFESYTEVGIKKMVEKLSLADRLKKLRGTK